jgi:hypothetical protein
MIYKWPNSRHETWYNPTEVMLYKTKDPEPRLVVVDAASMTGIPLSDFQVIQDFPQGVISPETMAAVPKTPWSQHSYSYSPTGVITKVSSQMPEDTIRAVYVNFSEVPSLLVSSTNREFRRLDLGNLVRVPRGSDNNTFSIENRLDHHRVSYTVEALDKRQKDADKAYSEAMAKLRQQMVDKLVAGTIEEGVIGGYRLNNPRSEIAYSDTVIQVPRPQFGGAVDYLNRNCKAGAIDVDSMIRGLAGNPCKGIPIRVNGTSVTLDIRPSTNGAALAYINNHKVAQNDVNQVLNSVVCYPGAQEAYDDFVTTSSKVSLKFHRAVANSVRWNLNGAYSAAPADSDDSPSPKKSLPKLVDANGKKIRMPEFMSKSDDNGMTCLVSFRKSPGKRCEAFLLGQWRKVRDFDILVRFLTETSAKGWVRGSWGRGVHLATGNVKTDANGDQYSEASEGDMEQDKTGKFVVKKAAKLNHADEPFVQLIARLDDCLMEESWIIPASNYCADTERHRRSSQSGQFLLRATQESATLIRAAKMAVAGMFRDSTNTAVDKLIRSRALLEQVMAETGAEEFQKGGKWTFRVTGRSGHVYTIDEETAGVHDGSGQHICIVRASSKFENAGYDYIASLLCVLRDDRYTAKDVYTLKNRVGA